MKLSEYIANLNRMVKEEPALLEFDVVTSSDDEGNSYNRVYHSPTVGCYEHGEFYTECDSVLNAVCVN